MDRIGRETLVTVPTIDAITGDKLTAFALTRLAFLFQRKDKQSFSMEISKQLFDLSKLFEKITNIEMVAQKASWLLEQEIKYRNDKLERKQTPIEVLQDTIDTCVVIVKRGGGSDDEKEKFAELQGD